MAGVVCDRLSRRYGPVTAVRELSLEVCDREFLVLVGPSGCGKTTLLRLIAGLEEPSAGSVSIGGRCVDGLPPEARDIAMVFQSYALYPHMTVRRNIDFGLRILGLDRAEIDRRTADAARILGLEACLDRKPRQLSGGERQRVAVGRAIVRQPSVFLFDEPLSNLDAGLRVQMRAEIVGLQRRLRTTTLYVTHDQTEALTMGDRIAVLAGGELQQLGTPQEVYDRPANLFVARFIGAPPMNVLAGRLSRDGARLQAAGLDLPLPPAQRAAAAPLAGREILAGVRPEHLRRTAPAGGGPAALVTATVEHVEMLGHASILHGRAADAVLTALVEPGSAAARGETVDLYLVLDRLHLFAPADGRRLDP